MTASPQRLAAEFLGTALLLFVIVGSGIVVQSGSTDATLQILTHAVAVGAGLAALIAFLAPVSGAHFNPSVTIGFWLTSSIDRGVAVAYMAAQVVGAVCGVLLASLTFSQGLGGLASTHRVGVGSVVAEFVVTFVLVLLILGLVRSGRSSMVPAAVGAWVAAIIIGTVSTGFANPAVTVARALTDTYTGIAPTSVPGFLLAELAGGLVAVGAAVLLFRMSPLTVHESAKEPT